MNEELNQIISDLDNAVNLLSGVFNGLDNIDHLEKDQAYNLYTGAEELHIRLKEEA